MVWFPSPGWWWWGGVGDGKVVGEIGEGRRPGWLILKPLKLAREAGSCKAAIGDRGCEERDQLEGEAGLGGGLNQEVKVPKE